MPLYVLRYKRMQGRLAPIITVGIKLEETWYPIETYIDSGAAYTLLKAGIAEGAGFDYRAGHLTSCQVGDGNFIPVYLHELELQIGSERFVAPVGFSERLGVVFHLLGRDGVFSRFKICFQEQQRLLTLEM
ncbi:MAG: hypothetical protein OEU26_08185 [Candidatus Tectomicrobia bacterium]|nr:hypothetical protein [Candidatus Tectomicrobia bacterium]